MVAGRRAVVWADRARRALDDAIAYVAQDSPQNARELLHRLLEAAESLAELSERGRPVPEVSATGVRELLVNPYRLVYELSGSRVIVVALLHQRRDFERWQSSRPG